MRALTFFAFFAVLMLTPSCAHAQCVVQSYSDPKSEPDWACPGPDEGILIPEVRLRPSIGLEVGAAYRRSRGEGEIQLNFPMVLMDRDRVLHLGMKIKALRKLRWLERHRMDEVLRVERRYMQDRLKAQLDLEKSRVKVALQQRDRLRKSLSEARAWYRSWTFGFIVGVVTVASATAATIVLLQ